MVVAAAVAAVAGMAILALTSGSDDDESDRDGGVRTVQPGAPGEPGRELTDEEAEAVGSPDHNEADVAFMQGMIVHHQQALEMTALVADRTERDDLALLAERITLTQQDEIDQTETWLTDRDEPLPDHQAHTAMPGMATADQLASLAAARGPDFDQLFLDLMIAHHQGALTMVGDLYAAGGGIEPAADRFAREVDADQTVEIQRMQELSDASG